MSQFRFDPKIAPRIYATTPAGAARKMGSPTPARLRCWEFTFLRVRFELLTPFLPAQQQCAARISFKIKDLRK
jgi:hypothetical protein